VLLSTAAPSIDVAPDTLTVPKKPVLPVIVVVPNTLSVLPKLVGPLTFTVPKKPVLPVIVVAPNTLSVLPKLVAPDTFNVPPTIASATEILPEIGMPVILVPSP